MERLTPAEEKIMLKLWALGKSNVKEIVEMYPEPKPAYNTISTIIRILEKKKFVHHKPVGRGYIYVPKITKEKYRDYLADTMLEHYFDNDRKAILSYYNSRASLMDLL